jgi:hypothetical protein
VTTLSAGTVAWSMPERPSAAVQWTSTSPLYQSFAFASVVAAPVSVGGVRSMLTWSRDAEAELPARSETLRVTLWSAPSVARSTVPGQIATPVSLSAQSNAAETVPLVHANPF